MSVSTSLLEKTKIYIRNQREHHANRDFLEEWRVFMRKNGFTPDQA